MATLGVQENLDEWLVRFAILLWTVLHCLLFVCRCQIQYEGGKYMNVKISIL